VAVFRILDEMPRSRIIFPLGIAPDAMPFSFIASRLVKNDEFRADISGIAKMPDDQFRTLTVALANFPSFLDKAAVDETIAKVTPRTDAKTAAFVSRLNEVVRSSSDSVERAVELLIEELGKHEEFQQNLSGILQERIKALLIPRGFDLQKKAELLAEATGAELANFAIICDVRPVFDDDRKKIEGAVAVTTLRLELYQPDGNKVPIECRLTEPQLARLAKVVETAQGKLSAITNLLETKNVPLAKTANTIEASK
jgi:hypothetical protein